MILFLFFLGELHMESLLTAVSSILGLELLRHADIVPCQLRCKLLSHVRLHGRIGITTCPGSLRFDLFKAALVMVKPVMRHRTSDVDRAGLGV